MNGVAIPLPTVLSLLVSNVFMTIAWYGRLKNLADKPHRLRGGFTLAQLRSRKR